MPAIAAVTFDCANALTTATFWSKALGRPIADGQPPSEHFAMIPPADGAPSMLFIQVPEAKQAKNRCHLDLAVGDDEDHAEVVARLIELGATHIHDKEEWGVTWTTLADPEGNEFCVARHDH